MYPNTGGEQVVLQVSKTDWLPSFLESQLSFHFVLGQSTLSALCAACSERSLAHVSVLLVFEIRILQSSLGLMEQNETEKGACGRGQHHCCGSGPGMTTQGTSWHISCVRRLVSSLESWEGNLIPTAAQGREGRRGSTAGRRQPLQSCQEACCLP